MCVSTHKTRFAPFVNIISLLYCKLFIPRDRWPAGEGVHRSGCFLREFAFFSSIPYGKSSHGHPSPLPVRFQGQEWLPIDSKRLLLLLLLLLLLYSASIGDLENALHELTRRVFLYFACHLCRQSPHYDTLTRRFILRERRSDEAGSAYTPPPLPSKSVVLGGVLVAVVVELPVCSNSSSTLGSPHQVDGA